jgi:hypothetical protein
VADRTLHPAASSTQKESSSSTATTAPILFVAFTQYRILMFHYEPATPRQMQFQCACPLPSMLSGTFTNTDAVCAYHLPSVPVEDRQGATAVRNAPRLGPTSGGSTLESSAGSNRSFIAVCMGSPSGVVHWALGYDPATKDTTTKATTMGAVHGAFIEPIALHVLPQTSPVVCGNTCWLAIQPLLASPVKPIAGVDAIATSQKKPRQPQRETSHVQEEMMDVSCVCILTGLRVVCPLVVPRIVLGSIGNTSQCDPPLQIIPVHATSSSSESLVGGREDASTWFRRHVWFQCPRVYGTYFPRKEGAVLNVISVALHSSMHLVAVLVRVPDTRTSNVNMQLLIQSLRDVHVSSFAAGLDALGVWKRFAYCFTTYPKDACVSREYILDQSQRIHQTTYYHERHALLLMLGNGVERQTLRHLVTHVDASFLDEATRTLVALLDKFLAQRAKFGVEMITRFGWTSPPSLSSSFHWRATLLTMHRIFSVPFAAVEFTLGRALLGLRAWLRWAQQAYKSLSPAPPSSTDASTTVLPTLLPQAFHCSNAVAFVKQYIALQKTASWDDQRQRDPPSLSSTDGALTPQQLKHYDVLKISTTTLMSRTPKERDAYCTSLSTFVSNVEAERGRVAAHPVTRQFWPSGPDACSVCGKPIVNVTFPLDLVLHHSNCDGNGGGDRPVTHTTLFSPVTFASVNLYDASGGTLVAQCPSCLLYQVVVGAHCELCDMTLS